MPPGAQPPQTDVIPQNGWIMEVGTGLVSPHFHKLTGLNRKTGTVEVVDGGTNRKFFFSDGIIEHDKISVTRSRDGSAADRVFAQWIRDVFANGGKKNGQMVQFRHGREILRINFQGMLFNDYTLADFDTHGSDKSDQTYQCACDWWEEEYL